MDSINSISKGTFLFKNGKDIKELRKKRKQPTPISEECTKQYYRNFKDVWSNIEQKISKIQSESYEKTLLNLISYIGEANTKDVNLQTAVLLTGINQTDHFKQFDVLSEKISNNSFSIVSILKSMNCPNIKSSIESLVSALIYNKTEHNDVNDVEEEASNLKLKKKQLTLSVLEAYYNNKYKDAAVKPKLVIILADFEQFPPQVVQDLISILCSYTSKLPLVLIIGIATAFKTLHSVLPFHITNKIAVNIFPTESSSSMLNSILDEIILTHHSPFFLSGKSFQILLDIFLFYDYSLHSFIQGFKIFMLEHYSTNIYASVYYKDGKVFDKSIESLTHEDCEWIRRYCTSFRDYVESLENPQIQIDLIKNDDALKKLIHRKGSRIYRFFLQFFCCLRILAVLIEDLPRNSLGKQLRELYPLCSETEITKLEEFQECFKLMRFTSKDKFLAKLDKIIKILESYVHDESVNEHLRENLSYVYEKMQEFYVKISEAGMTPVKDDREKVSEFPSVNKPEVNNKKGAVSRHEMMQKLKETAMNQPAKIVIEYERILYECLEYIHSVFERHLLPFNKAPALWELSVFSDYNTVRHNIVGAPRGILQQALVNPHHYLQCNCCSLKDNEQILSTMPEISVAYKLHLECNKFINLFDWLQSFAMVIDNKDCFEEEDNISPEVQAKFTRCVAELQFLGFIKQAKQKTDHVMRLTW